MRAVRAELRKLGTLPAVPVTAALTVAATLLLALAAAAARDRGELPGPDPALLPLRYAQAGFLVLGVLAAASEYRHGTVRVTLLAMPRRGRLQAARAVALTAVAVPAAAATVAATAVLPTDAAGAATVLVHLVLAALTGSAVALLVRQATPATVLLLAVYFVACPVLRAGTGLGPYLPDAACAGTGIGTALTSAAWAAAALAIASWSFARRDA